MRAMGMVGNQGFIPAVTPQADSPSKQQRDGRQAGEAQRTPLGLALTLLILAATGAGIALTIAGILHPEPVDWPVLLVFVALAVAAERTDLSMYGDSRVSLAFIPIFGSVLLCGITGLALVVPAGILASAINRPIHKTAFNYGTLMVAGGASVAVLNATGGNLDYAHDWPQVLGPVVAAGAANFAVNSALISAAIALTNRTSIKDVWSEHFMWLSPHYLILSVLALAVVAADAAMGLWGIAVFLTPPIMMKLSIKQYLDRTTKGVLDLRDTHKQLQVAHGQLTEAMASLGNAYDGTLRSLVAALDARDSETAGHSERVADLTVAIADELGIQRDTDDWRYIAWGALLHDVGKIAIPDGILLKPGSLTDNEWETMRTHARAGYEILKTVDFLAPAADIVLAHHERYDGGGYPRGLVGEEIPLGARIFMIADAFDAMTSHRSYRGAMPAEQALAEILKHSGTQFDPVAVRGFLSVYQKRFVGTVHHRHFLGSDRGPQMELSASVRKAIAEAAGLDEVA